MKEFIKNNKIILMISFIYSYMFLFYEQLCLYASNIDDFWYDIYKLFPVVLIELILSFLIISAALIILRKINSKLFKIIGEKEIMVNSLHHIIVSEVGNEYRVAIKSEDGVIEGIEYYGDDRFMIGVQFHPEILPQFNNIFEYFIKECEKRN